MCTTMFICTHHVWRYVAFLQHHHMFLKSNLYVVIESITDHATIYQQPLTLKDITIIFLTGIHIYIINFSLICLILIFVTIIVVTTWNIYF